MLLTQFILVDAHFVLSLLAALVTLAIAWLYFDAWLANKKMKETTLFFGFLFLAISFLAQSVIVDQALLASSIMGTGTANLIKIAFRILGLSVLIFGELTIPLQPIPGKGKAGAFMLPISTLPVVFVLPVMAAGTALLYLRRATVGLENHLKPIALGFFLLSLSELMGLSILFRETNNIILNGIVAAFGPLWILERVFLGLAVIIMGKWVFGYLVKRFDTQLFMILTTTSLVIFLATTVFFTYATLRNLTNEAFDSLRTDVGVLAYSIESKKGELTSSAQAIAQNPSLSEAVVGGTRSGIASVTSPFLTSKNVSSIVVVSDVGEILFKAEDPEFFGGSLSDNPLIKRALLGENASGVSTKTGVTAPVVSISSAVPVKVGEKTVGAVLISFDIDNAFVDGVKSATGLDMSVYADNIRSATTFVAPDGVSRWVGIAEEDGNIKKTVLVEGQTFTGNATILNTPYFASFSPLVSVDEYPVGMLFTGRPQVSVLQTAARALETTFLVTVMLLVLSLLPSYFISRNIANQIK